ncbi:polysaccharide deacetylase family protein [Fervidibacillus halotolerans]|uniref:Polysaccharide deacetylase family protein n=1 Tax=Fervidibacillus halotolerans TaxID=2980027 RepID=A0A9E8M1P1_9BACI|nr:polysaccharide deacetylase family protein [Fervidibacillus halotolerans]WAA12654.1 polysaccharide deacetylase family protein [Fervidibacillus halotolerans]
MKKLFMLFGGIVVLLLFFYNYQFYKNETSETISRADFKNHVGKLAEANPKNHIETVQEHTVNKHIRIKDEPNDQTIVPVLMYHHFVEEGEKVGYTTISNVAFEEQIKYLKSKGYNTVTDQDIVDYYYNGKKLPENPIQITMDDGYESNYKLAYPILKKYGMKATIFVIVSRIGEEYLPPRLTWDQIKEMSDSGVMSIQSHTYDMHHKVMKNDSVEVSAMISDNNEEFLKSVKDDLIRSKEILEEKLGKEVISLSYPYGHYNEEILSVVKEVGFKLAYTVQSGLNNVNTNELELFRINVSSMYNGKAIEEEIKKQKELLNSQNNN